MTYQQNDNVKLQVTFYSFPDGSGNTTATDLTGNCTYTIYSRTGPRTSPVFTQLATGTATHGTTGVYYVHYTMSTIGWIAYEFSGVSGTYPIVARGEFEVKFVN